MIHPTEIRGFSSTKEAARHFADLRYDVLEEFLVHLSDEIWNDGAKDSNRGRNILARQLMNVSNDLAAASIELSNVWKVCKYHMGEQ